MTCDNQPQQVTLFFFYFSVFLKKKKNSNRVIRIFFPGKEGTRRKFLFPRGSDEVYPSRKAKSILKQMFLVMWPLLNLG